MSKKKLINYQPLFVERIFEFPIFEFKMSCLLGKTAKIAYESFTSEKLELNHFAFVVIRDHSKNHPLIIFPHNVDLNTIAHEVSHAVNHFVTYLSATDEDELRAYHTGYLVENIYNFVQENKDRFK